MLYRTLSLFRQCTTALQCAALAALTLTLAGCATPLPHEALAAEHKVALCVALGDTLHFIHTGVTVFGNEEFSAQVPTWQVNAEGARSALQRLSREPARQVAVLPDCGEGATPRTPADLKAPALAAARAASAQYLVLVLPEDPPSESPAAFMKAAFGYYGRTAPIPLHETLHTPYVMFAVRVLETNTGQQVAYAQSRTLPERRKALPLEPGFPWRATLDAFPAADQARMAVSMRGLVAAGVDQALADIGY